MSDRSSVRSLGTTQYDEEAHQQVVSTASAGNALGGFGLLLRQGVSQRLETQGQTIFFVARVEKGGPAYAAGLRADDTLESVDGGKREEGGTCDALGCCVRPRHSMAVGSQPRAHNVHKIICRQRVHVTNNSMQYCRTQMAAETWASADAGLDGSACEDVG